MSAQSAVSSVSRKFFRLADTGNGGRGLWYASNGVFTGLIHTQFSFCTNSALEMPFDPELVGWLSAAETLDDLFHWFSREDIAELEKYGYRIAVYEATVYRTYKNHWVVDQESSVLVETLLVETIPMPQL